MQAGKLRHRVRIQQPSTAQDDFGQVSEDGWHDVMCVYARIEDLAGKQVYAVNAGFTSDVSHRITIRYPSIAITSGMRVVFAQRVFAVQYVAKPDEERPISLHILCLEQDK